LALTLLKVREPTLLLEFHGERTEHGARDEAIETDTRDVAVKRINDSPNLPRWNSVEFGDFANREVGLDGHELCLLK